MASCLPRGFLIPLPSTGSNKSEKRYSAFEVRVRIIEKLGGYRNVKNIYKINGILGELRFARKNGLCESELELLLQKAEEIAKK